MILSVAVLDKYGYELVSKDNAMTILRRGGFGAQTISGRHFNQLDFQFLKVNKLYRYFHKT